MRGARRDSLKHFWLFCSCARAGLRVRKHKLYPSTCTVTPEPPVMEETFARIKFARTPETVRDSPAVTVDVSIVEYCASASVIAVCSTILTALGAPPKMVCQRIA